VYVSTYSDACVEIVPLPFSFGTYPSCKLFAAFQVSGAELVITILFPDHDTVIPVPCFIYKAPVPIPVPRESDSSSLILIFLQVLPESALQAGFPEPSVFHTLLTSAEVGAATLPATFKALRGTSIWLRLIHSVESLLVLN